jgi:cellulose synthase/poly-beta-1,6-N-acetylglucosamine synthase-like glycosyltransferase
VHVPTVVKRPAWRSALFTVALGGALACAVVVHEYRREIFPAPNLPGLAALASLSVVVVAGLQLVLFIAGSIRSVPLRSSRSTPSVAFLVPAYNEQHGIVAVIRALDAAAAGYDGRCRLYLVDNASTDRTAREARAALAGCHALEGDVLTCRQRGKSHALNHGLAQTTEEIVVRVDADTIVPPTLLHDVVAYFDQPNVGGVSGIPLPRPDTPRALYAIRLMEVLYSVSFLRTGQSSVDATLVMPGNMSAYRGSIVRSLGFAAGFNGEDTDVAVRIGRLGYRVVTDTRIRFLTEVPATLPHLVEQRTRWTRGVLYVAARNKSSLPLRQGLRGMLLLPWSALSACRRSLTLPLFVCLGASALVDPEMLSVRQVAVVGGAVLGVHLVLVTALVVVRGRLNAVPYLPAYVLFRLFKVYVAFGALLTLEPRPTRARPRPAPVPAY